MKRDEIFRYVKDQYGTEPEYLWKKDPDSAVLRHKNKKWYAIIMSVEKKKLGLEENGNIDILNVKCDPELVGMIIQTYGFLPGYHMNSGIGLQSFWMVLSVKPKPWIFWI